MQAHSVSYPLILSGSLALSLSLPLCGGRVRGRAVYLSSPLAEPVRVAPARGAPDCDGGMRNEITTSTLLVIFLIISIDSLPVCIVSETRVTEQQIMIINVREKNPEKNPALSAAQYDRMILLLHLF